MTKIVGTLQARDINPGYTPTTHEIIVPGSKTAAPDLLALGAAEALQCATQDRRSTGKVLHFKVSCILPLQFVPSPGPLRALWFQAEIA